MNYTDIINQAVAEAVDREVENRLAAKNGEIASLKELLAGRDREVVRLVDEINELKRSSRLYEPLEGAPRNPDVAEADEELRKKDKEIIALRGDVLDKGSRINSLQAELNGVRGALKNHVDSEGKLRKELDDANARIAELDAMVDERDTRIEELDGKVEEKDNLIEKYKDMADAISDWASNDMPSLDPDDY